MNTYSILITSLIGLSFTFSYGQSVDKAKDVLFYEYGPPETIWLNSSERQSMFEKAKMLDKAIRESLIEKANQALADDPNPTDTIFYEGLVSNHPRRLEMQEHFEDLTNLSLLINAFLLTGNNAYRDQTMRILLAWAETYIPTGNDVNENKLRDFFYAYEIHREYFTEKEKTLVEHWLNTIAQRQIEEWDIEFGSSNRHAKRMKLILMAGLTFDNQEYINFAIAEIEKILDASLYADGTSRDLERRDAIHYHNSQVKNYLILNYLTRLVGKNIYTELQAEGGSIQKSIHYMFPYIRGQKVHPEWVNSKIGLDKRRYEAGDDYYKPGKPWDAKEAYSTMVLASPFDKECQKLVTLLEQQEGLEVQNWLKFQVQMVEDIKDDGK